MLKKRGNILSQKSKIRIDYGICFFCKERPAIKNFYLNAESYPYCLECVKDLLLMIHSKNCILCGDLLGDTYNFIYTKDRDLKRVCNNCNTVLTTWGLNFRPKKNRLEIFLTTDEAITSEIETEIIDNLNRILEKNKAVTLITEKFHAGFLMTKNYCKKTKATAKAIKKYLEKKQTENIIIHFSLKVKENYI